MSASPATPIGPRAIASNPIYRRRPSNPSAHGARDGVPWPSDFGAAPRSGTLRTSMADLLGGSTPHYAPTMVFTDMSIPTDPSRHPSSVSPASLSPHRFDVTGSPQRCSTA